MPMICSSLNLLLRIVRLLKRRTPVRIEGTPGGKVIEHLAERVHNLGLSWWSRSATPRTHQAFQPISNAGVVAMDAIMGAAGWQHISSSPFANVPGS